MKKWRFLIKPVLKSACLRFQRECIIFSKQEILNISRIFQKIRKNYLYISLFILVWKGIRIIHSMMNSDWLLLIFFQIL